MSEIITVPVELGARSYDVIVGEHALRRASAALAQACPRGRAFVVADKAALSHHGGALNGVLDAQNLHADLYVIEGGEASKSWDALRALVDWMIAQGMERNDSLIAFGGGTVGDLTGFAASVMKRGCQFVQIPTTLLAQVDSSVGGKTGINTAAGKNLVGTFHQPALVIADTAFLATLPAREVRAGYAEIIKAGLIGDLDLFERLEALGPAALSGAALSQAIADAVAFKARIVAQDERESGVRALLNLGHTFAHAFEAEAERGTLIHGEAVAAGLGLAFAYSERTGVCPPGAAARVKAHLNAVGLPSNPAALAGGPYQAERLVARMTADKKNTGGSITLVLARALGEAYIAPGANADELRAFLDEDLKR